MASVVQRSMQLLGRNSMAHNSAMRNSVTTVGRRNLHVDMEGKSGKTLPFDIQNKWTLMLKFTFFVGSAFSTPFLLVRHQLKKKSGA